MMWGLVFLRHLYLIGCLWLLSCKCSSIKTLWCERRSNLYLEEIWSIEGLKAQVGKAVQIFWLVEARIFLDWPCNIYWVSLTAVNGEDSELLYAQKKKCFSMVIFLEHFFISSLKMEGKNTTERKPLKLTEYVSQTAVRMLSHITNVVNVKQKFAFTHRFLALEWFP